MSYIKFNKIRVAKALVDFINDRVLPGLALDTAHFWQHFEAILVKNMPQNGLLLHRRDELQRQIDHWHQHNTYDENDLRGYTRFLREIGYLLDEGDDFKVTVSGVDREISSVAAPQLVVPINNARFAINAANARWGSLYDALYGSDMIADEGLNARTSGYNPARGEQVFMFCENWLDQVLPLEHGSHADAVDYSLTDSDGEFSVLVVLSDGSQSSLRHPEQFCGHASDPCARLLFIHHDLHFELQIDKAHAIGSHQRAGLKNIVLEAAVTTIQDCEDSVAAVDIDDKLKVYANWLGLMQGNLSFKMKKSDNTYTRRLNPDRVYRDNRNQPFTLAGRSLMLIRNTGIHMLSELALTASDDPVPEGIVDALITVLIALHDRQSDAVFCNSPQHSIYIVKPKLHGPDEVAFSCHLFSDIEAAYGLPANTIKIGIMDEERRTTINLKECIRQARQRVIFINTGFLDRTGDEIHTGMEAGAMLPKAEIKQARWIGAYENRNVDIGLRCGLDGVGQIGKGMWAEPDNLREMYRSKIAHPEAGANCAWVPSPSAATLHALHYHQINVKQRQQQLKTRTMASLEDVLRLPLLPRSRVLSAEQVQLELDNNAQGILGYVVKWIDSGIGCSKVPDIHHVGLMEDRATLRISSQHMANWLRHGLCTEQQIMQTFQRMALIVDQQNQGSHGYSNMAPDYQGMAFKAAVALVLQGRLSPNGYTEQLLTEYRRREKMA